MEFESVNYITHPLSVGELKELLQRAGLAPQDVMRTKEPGYREFVAGKISAMKNSCRSWPLIRNCYSVVRGEKGVLARPVENLAKLGIH